MRPVLLLTACALQLAALSGCIIGDENWQRPRDLPSPYVVDRTRVLAIQVEPPEANPGEPVTATALLPDPDGIAEIKLWTWCPPELASGFGCLSQSEDSFFGYEPIAPVGGTVPETALDEATDEQKLNGIYWTIQVMAAPASLLEEVDESAFEDPEFFNSVESAHKRLTVSETETPNHNPSATTFLADGVELPTGSVWEVDGGQGYDVEIVLEDGAVEDYSYQLRDGTVEDRTEELYGTWFATDGFWFNPFTLAPFWETQWTAPDDPGAEGSIWVVLRDRRGGTGWIEQRYRVRE